MILFCGMLPQLIRIGEYTLNLANFAYIEEVKGGFRVVFTGTVQTITFSGPNADRVKNLLADTRYCWEVPEDTTSNVHSV